MQTSTKVAFVVLIVALAASWVALRQKNAALSERVAASAASSTTGEE